MIMNRISLAFTLFISSLFLSNLTFAQGDLTLGVSLSETTDKYELVPHADTSSLPDTLYFKGKIVEFHRGICGDLCTGGTVKIKLTNPKPIEGYPYQYVYLVTSCSDGKAVAEDIILKASKYTGKEKECYYENVVDIANSKGIPFYKLSKEDTKKLTSK